MFKARYFALMGFVVLTVNAGMVRKEMTNEEWGEFSKYIKMVRFEKVSHDKSIYRCFDSLSNYSDDFRQLADKLKKDGVIAEGQVWIFTEEEECYLQPDRGVKLSAAGLEKVYKYFCALIDQGTNDVVAMKTNPDKTKYLLTKMGDVEVFKGKLKDILGAYVSTSSNCQNAGFRGFLENVIKKEFFIAKNDQTGNDIYSIANVAVNIAQSMFEGLSFCYIDGEEFDVDGFLKHNGYSVKVENPKEDIKKDNDSEVSVSGKTGGDGIGSNVRVKDNRSEYSGEKDESTIKTTSEGDDKSRCLCF